MRPLDDDDIEANPPKTLCDCLRLTVIKTKGLFRDPMQLLEAVINHDKEANPLGILCNYLRPTKMRIKRLTLRRPCMAI